MQIPIRHHDLGLHGLLRAVRPNTQKKYDNLTKSNPSHWIRSWDERNANDNAETEYCLSLSPTPCKCSSQPPKKSSLKTQLGPIYYSFMRLKLLANSVDHDQSNVFTAIADNRGSMSYSKYETIKSIISAAKRKKRRKNTCDIKHC